MGELRAQDHTGRKRNPKRREQTPSDSRAVESQRIVGPFWEAAPPTFNLFLQKGQLELFGPETHSFTSRPRFYTRARGPESGPGSLHAEKSFLPLAPAEGKD